MKTIKDGLIEMERLYPNEIHKLSDFGFNDEEMREFIEEEIEEDRFMWQTENQWRASLPKPVEETAQGFLDDGSLTKDEAFEMRKKDLYAACEESMRRYYTAKMKREPFSEDLEQEKNNAVTRYQAHIFRPDYYNRSYSPEEIERANAVEITRLIELNRMGFALCIFHNERTPSLHVTKNMFYCFGCHASGRTIDFVMRQRNIGFKDAVGFLAGL